MIVFQLPINQMVEAITITKIASFICHLPLFLLDAISWIVNNCCNHFTGPTNEIWELLDIFIISKKNHFIFANNFYNLKQVLLLIYSVIFPVLLFAQQSDSSLLSKDSSNKLDSPDVQLSDSLSWLVDSSVKKVNKVTGLASYSGILKNTLETNQFLNSTTKPVASIVLEKKRASNDLLFYLVAFFALMMAFLRFFYAQYFNNLFRVFFNASLRQSQLTEQLLQAKLPSLLFNMLFVFSGGLYVYLLLLHYHWIELGDFWKPLAYCILSLGLIYLVKFFTLKFTGWLTGLKEVTNTYLFVIFLINKIVGVILLPFIVVISFSIPSLVNSAIIISLLLVGVLFLLRFFRSYGLLQNQLKVSRFHFFMYVAGVEIIPVLLVYKGLVVLLSKNL